LVAIYSQLMQSLLRPDGIYTVADVDAALARVFGVGVRLASRSAARAR
jgi:hypothetical protein